MRYTALYNTNVSFKKSEIDKQFLVNKRLLDVTLRGIINERNDSIPQPRIIIGAEGTGKSWFLLAIRDLLKEEYHNFNPLYVDATDIISLSDFDPITSSIEDKETRTVLLVDNIDNFFSQLSDQEQYALRSKLNTNGAPVLICTAAKTPKALTDYSSAFFDGFDIQYIDKVPLETGYDIIGANNDRQKQRANILLSIIGNGIRGIMMTKNILSMSSSAETDSQIIYDLIYAPTRMRIKSLPKVSQQIIAYLALADTGKSLADIREGLNIESSKLSPYITQLISQGILSKEEETVRKSRYSLADKILRFFLFYQHSK